MAVSVSTAVPGDLWQTARHRAQSDVTNQLHGSHISAVNRMVRSPFVSVTARDAGTQGQHFEITAEKQKSSFKNTTPALRFCFSSQPLSCNSDWNTTGPGEFKAISKKPRQECNFYSILLLFLKLNGTSHKRWKLPGLENDGRHLHCKGFTHLMYVSIQF